MAQEDKQLLLNDMKTPDKLFVSCDSFGFISAYYIENHPPYGEEYLRKDLVDEMLKTAEDHAYFAGQEKLREKLLEWAKEKANDYKGTANIRRSFEMMIRKIESL